MLLVLVPVVPLLLTDPLSLPGDIGSTAAALEGGSAPEAALSACLSPGIEVPDKRVVHFWGDEVGEGG